MQIPCQVIEVDPFKLLSRNRKDLYNQSNNNFLGASLAAHGDMVVTCMPRAKSNWYERGSVTGACFGKENSADSMTLLFDIPRLSKNDWRYLRMMGHSISLTNKNELIIGAPLATPEIPDDIKVKECAHLPERDESQIKR